jgi:hypothetical protein
VASYVQKGNPVIPIALKIPVDTLPPGEYRIELQSGDAGGALSNVRKATFQTE